MEGKLGKAAGFAARLTLGLMWAYAGYEKILTEMSGKMVTSGFLSHTSGTFAVLFNWMAGNPVVDKLVVWGELLIGVALILGVAMRFTALMGLLQAALFSLATYPASKDAVMALVDKDIAFTVMFLMLLALSAGTFLGVDGLLKRSKFVQGRPTLARIHAALSG